MFRKELKKSIIKQIIIIKCKIFCRSLYLIVDFTDLEKYLPSLSCVMSPSIRTTLFKAPLLVAFSVSNS